MREFLEKAFSYNADIALMHSIKEGSIIIPIWVARETQIVRARKTECAIFFTTVQ